jgi:hypothetical protein
MKENQSQLRPKIQSGLKIGHNCVTYFIDGAICEKLLELENKTNHAA